jgi:hypothetical protein
MVWFVWVEKRAAEIFSRLFKPESISVTAGLKSWSAAKRKQVKQVC